MDVAGEERNVRLIDHLETELQGLKPIDGTWLTSGLPSYLRTRKPRPPKETDLSSPKDRGLFGPVERDTKTRTLGTEGAAPVEKLRNGAQRGDSRTNFCTRQFRISAT